MDIFHYIGIGFSSAIALAFAMILMSFVGCDIPYFKKTDRYILICFIVGEVVIINDKTMADNMMRVGYRLHTFKGRHIRIKILKWQV